jgi:hypothetical protein
MQTCLPKATVATQRASRARIAAPGTLFVFVFGAAAAPARAGPAAGRRGRGRPTITHSHTSPSLPPARPLKTSHTHTHTHTKNSQDRFYELANPERENLCLYGNPDGTWEVDLPAEEVPPELPEPALGINFARDGMQRPDWLALVAVHADTWLMAVAFYNGARLNRPGRDRLFSLINELPTCYEIVSGRSPDVGDGQAGLCAPSSGMMAATTGAGGGGGATGGGGRGTKRSGGGGATASGGGGGGGGRSGKAARGDATASAAARNAAGTNGNGAAAAAEYADGEGDPCPRCGRIYRVGEFWIACDACDVWYDGDCVGMTAAKAQRLGTWKCPKCA